MRPKSLNARKPAEQVVKDIHGATRRHFSAEGKIRSARVQGAQRARLAAHRDRRAQSIGAGSASRPWRISIGPSATLLRKGQEGATRGPTRACRLAAWIFISASRPNTSASS